MAFCLAGGFILLLQHGRAQSGKGTPSGFAEFAKVETKYSGSATCEECHREEYRFWKSSHHGRAERKPEAFEDLAFSPARKVPQGHGSNSVQKTGATYEVITGSSGTTQQTFAVRRVLGESPLRQFLVSFPGGRLQALEAAYDPGSNEWFDVYGRENRHAGEWGHWTGRGMNWNSMCASCHNTGLQKNYDAATDSYKTIMVEESVGCEACHGPLQLHEQWQRKLGRSGAKDPTIRKLTADQTDDNCGFCHARRGELTGAFKPGDAFLDHMQLEMVNGSEIFYPDGQVHEEDYEYAPFLGSKMHQRGVHCQDCHNPHSAKLILPGNWLCMRCHNGSYTNAPAISPVEHSHHKVFGYDAHGVATNLDLIAYKPAEIQETGGECVNCHMPQTVYMQRHWRHDHGFTIPDPFLTTQTGVPNACNRCHREKDPEWALQWCKKWYGQKMERPSRSRALLVAAARKLDPAARPGLMAMLTTNEIPYWRAVAAGLLGPWVTHPQVQVELRHGLSDTNALVRIECIRALESVATEPETGEALKHILSDPVRGVRVAAAWALRASLDVTSKADAELQHCLELNADQPLGQVQLGAFALARSEPDTALRHYAQAVEWDPYSAALRHDYAVVLAGMQRASNALQQMVAACRLDPTNAEYQYGLGLAWNEAGNTSNTLECLQTAVRLAPNFATAWYNLGLALDSISRPEEALDALLRAESADRSDARAPYARAIILARFGRWSEAQRAVRRALEIEPKFNSAQQFLQDLEARQK